MLPLSRVGNGITRSFINMYFLAQIFGKRFYRRGQAVVTGVFPFPLMGRALIFIAHRVSAFPLAGYLFEASYDRGIPLFGYFF